jgi:hypothetical protein
VLRLVGGGYRFSTLDQKRRTAPSRSPKTRTSPECSNALSLHFVTDTD